MAKKNSTIHYISKFLVQSFWCRLIASFTASTVFPVKPWTPEKISGIFIVSQPIKCEMKPQKITTKPQHGSVTWFETMSCLFFHDKSSILPFLNTEIALFAIQLIYMQRIDMNVMFSDILRESDVECMLRFVSYLLRFHLASDWSWNIKHSKNFLSDWCSRFYRKDCNWTC